MGARTRFKLPVNLPIYAFLVQLDQLAKRGGGSDSRCGCQEKALASASAFSVKFVPLERVKYAGACEIACGSEIRLRRVKERILFHIVAKGHDISQFSKGKLFHIRREPNISLDHPMGKLYHFRTILKHALHPRRVFFSPSLTIPTAYAIIKKKARREPHPCTTATIWTTPTPTARMPTC